MIRVNLNINDLLESLVENISARVNASGLAIKCDLNNLPDIIGDPDRLSKVFNNLLDNAIKFTPQGGLITVETNHVGKVIEISISDSGVGLDPDEFSRIFERFYQFDKSRIRGNDQGVGLGLSIAREIVLAHNGEILVKNNLPQGSKFIVRLPLSNNEYE